MLTIADLFKTSLQATQDISTSVLETTMEELEKKLDQAQEQLVEQIKTEVTKELTVSSSNVPSQKKKSVQHMSETKEKANNIENQSATEAKSKKPKLDMKVIGDSLKNACLESLDIGLDKVLAEAWSGWSDLEALADPEQTPPDEINIVPLAQHVIESAHKLEVDIAIGSVQLTTVNFEASIQLYLDGANLVIQKGAIQEISIGQLQAGCALNIGKTKLIDLPVFPVNIPLSHKFEPAIPIKVKDLFTEEKQPKLPE
ncbi:MAG: hypothetical protein HRT37_02520 [Alteromonadaceae bacterium]|nr:hypothetical protein [Alteromonadaceae bacterium]